MLALLTSAFLLAQYSYTSATEKNANEALADQVDTDAEDETNENGVLLQYESLWEQNHDMVDYGDAACREEHPVIRFDTLYELREYEVVATFYYDLNNDDFPHYQ
ncbi:MAG: hypothetical protein LIO95_00910 [Clostridiales bacterium]|nr:hypothetical protein [Clostridiales bacterium]